MLSADAADSQHEPAGSFLKPPIQQRHSMRPITEAVVGLLAALPPEERAEVLQRVQSAAGTAADHPVAAHSNPEAAAGTPAPMRTHGTDPPILCGSQAETSDDEQQ